VNPLKYMPLKADQCAKLDPSIGTEADPMAYEPTTSDLEYKALRAALSTLRSKLPKKGSTPRKRSRYSGLAARLEKALKKGL